jgi:hypothetical protein
MNERARHCRCLARLVAGALLALGCTKKVNTAGSVHSFEERRSKLDVSKPSVWADWRLEGRTIVGTLHVARCTTQRTWNEVETETTVHSSKEVGALIAAAGAVAAGVGYLLLAAAPDPGPPVCEMYLVSQTGGVDTWASSCSDPSPNNTVPIVLMVTGAAVAAAGAGLYVAPIRTRTVETRSKPRSYEAKLSCIQPSELGRIKLGVAIAPNKYVRVPVASDGRTEVTVPDELPLPQGETLNVIVLYAPVELATILPRGEVVGKLAAP